MIKSHNIMSIYIPRELYVLIASKMHPLYLHSFSATCREFRAIAGGIIMSYSKSDPYKIGNIYVLNKWHCNYPLLAKYGHRDLVKFNNCPTACLRTATDPDIILDLLKMKGDFVDKRDFKMTIIEGHMHIALQYKDKCRTKEYALKSKSFEMYNYMYPDKSGFRLYHVSKACKGGNKLIVMDILKHIEMEPEIAGELYIMNDPDLLQISIANKEPDMEDLAMACSFDNVPAVRYLINVIGDDAKHVYYAGSNREIINLLNSIGYLSDNCITLKDAFIAKDRELVEIVASRTHPNSHECFTHLEALNIFDKVIDDRELLKNFVMWTGGWCLKYQMALVIVASKRRLGNILHLISQNIAPNINNPNLIFIGALLGGHLANLQQLRPHINIQSIRELMTLYSVDVGILKVDVYMYLINCRIIEAKQVIYNLNLPTSHLKALVTITGIRSVVCKPSELSYDHMYALEMLGVRVRCDPEWFYYRAQFK